MLKSIPLIASPSGLIILDHHFQISQCNPQAAATFGYSVDELLGQPLDCLIPTNVRARHPDLVKAFVEKGASRLLESGQNMQVFPGLRKDGSLAHIQIGITLIKPEEGGQNSYVVAISDCSALHTLNSELLLSNGELKRRIGEVEAMKHAQSHLLHVISHELKSPLHITMSLLRLLADSRTTARERIEFSSELAAQIDYVISSLRLLIDFADYREGNFNLNPELLSLKAFFSTCVDIVQNTYPGIRSMLKVNAEVPEGLLVQVDRLRLQSVVVGLLSNAFRHARAAHIHLTIQLQGQGDGARLFVLVEDDGVGLNKALQHTIFEPLANLESRQRAGGGGLGIGLSMYRCYVQSMGGDMRLENPPGRTTGTCVQVEIPISVVHAAYDLKPEDKEANPAPLAGMHILLVDDDPMIRKVMGMRLKRLGAVVCVACQGQEAVTLAQSQIEFPFDLVLMDLDMPVMNGFDAIAAIRLLKAYAKTPIFVVTAAVESTVYPKAIGVGANGCYGKPFDPMQLLPVLQSVE